MNVFRNQHAVLTNEENDGVVGDYFLQADRDNREGLLQAQGIPKRLSKPKEQLSFLARWQDGTPKGSGTDFGLIRNPGETEGRRGRQFHLSTDAQRLRLAFH